MKQLITLLVTISIYITSQGQEMTLKEALSKKDTITAAGLISKGADINVLDNYGSSPLMQAARWGDEVMVSFLLRHGAKPDAPRSAKGRTVLMVACAYYAHTDVVQLLLDKGANVNAAANDGTTALMLASQFWKADIVSILLKAGADPKMKDAKGKTAIDYVNMNAVDKDMLQILKGFKVDKEAVLALLANTTK